MPTIRKIVITGGSSGLGLALAQHNVARAALPCLKVSQGQLVNIASMAALTGVFGYTPYTASKHALAGFTESMRYEMKPQGVTVQLICPPEFDSPMVEDQQAGRCA